MAIQLRRSEVAHLITLGHIIVLHRRRIYRLNSWLSKHPGGHLALLHFVGRDAANEIEAYHSEATLGGVMRSFVIAEVDGRDFDESDDDGSGAGWKPLTPLVQLSNEGACGRAQDYAGVNRSWKHDLALLRNGSFDCQRAQKRLVTLREIEPPSPPVGIDPVEQYRISRAWEVLNKKMEAAGFYDARPLWHYRTDLIRYFALFAAFLWVFLQAHQTWHYYVAAVLLGAFWHQVTFAVHDAGHTEVTGSYHADRVIGALIASWFGGLSCGWWSDNHNIHHLVTNHPEHDPDIQHIPFFAISPKFFGNLYSTYYRRQMLLDAASKCFISMQHNLYYIVMSLARFNLFANSYSFLLFRAKSGFYRNLELAGVAFFWLWFGGGVLRTIPDWTTRLGFVLLCFMVTSPIHVQITLSHFAQSTEDLGIYESFPARQLRTTMDVKCPEYIEWIHGGLNMQVTHHLFPRIPRHHLRRATALAREFAKEQRLEYHTYYFIEGNGRVLDVLKDVADQVKILGKVANAQARGEMHAH
ncbi:MAG: hypothetical protein CYPHOPRED_000398 [Cyphobasidiales sp. Tagirdzhanova-0007]|nr:MAG: hypothetical protein CYPHOPRED_000398 [Cyphobasidiales sp. Tagirdzhanova-0007]